MPDLDEHLATTRTRLLDDIEVPDLGRIARRAALLRRRRRAARAGGLVLALAVAGGALTAGPWTRGDPPAPPAATPRPSSPSASVYSGADLTVRGLLLGTEVTQLPGTLRDVEFADADHGWALAANCPEAAPRAACRLTVARTGDGGASWAVRAVADDGVGPEDVPDLVVLDATTLVLHGTSTWRISTDGGDTWTSGGAADGATATLDRGARPLLRPGGDGSCAGTVVEVWSPGYGYRGDLANQPPLDVCWVATRPGADGGWWVGGTVRGGSRPAAAVTRDGGATWQRTEFDDTGDSVRVATLGDHTYAVVVARDGEATALRAVYHAARPGGPFERTGRADGGLRTVGGEPVPLLDGRLLLADGQGGWFVSTDDGASFHPVDGLPAVSRFWRTPGGYVAFDMVAVGYAGFSPDGSTWRKLQVH